MEILGCTLFCGISIIIMVGLLIMLGLYNGKNRRDSFLARREELLAKYGNEEVVDMIMKEMFWQGQTQSQLVESLGSPIDIDRKVMKTKTIEVWKYNETGKGRYALRITIEDGIVVGWENKS